MRMILMIAGLLLCHFSSTAQSKCIENFIEKYAEAAHVNSLNLNDWTLQLTSAFTKKSTGERVKNKITRLRLLSSEQSELVSSAELQTFLNKLHKDHFEDLIEVRDKGSHIKFLLRENETHVTDIVMLVQGKENFVLLSLEGLFKLEDLVDWNVDIEGGEHLKQLADKV
ncbi:MAG: DUF4252 domain-containing protein [Bacteroidota bacterium]